MVRLARFIPTTILLASLVPGVANAQNPTPPGAKLDESLRESVERGCVGTQSVIIRTKPGYRQSLRDSLAAHGDAIGGEFPALEAIAATVHCDDLETLAGFDSTDSISTNGNVGVQSLTLDTTTIVTTTLVSQAEADLTAAGAALTASKTEAKAAQQALRDVEAQAKLAQAQLSAAQRVVRRASEAEMPAALASLASAQAAHQVAQDVLSAARNNLTLKHANSMRAQQDVFDKRHALDQAHWLEAREREGEAARALKTKFFATLPLNGQSVASTDEQLDAQAEESVLLETAFSGLQHRGGNGIGVAIIDSGIQPGLDFGDRITAFYDFTQGDIRPAGPSDAYGHGTHVAGLVASRFVGVAPDARLIGLKVLDEKGQGTTANVVRAIEFAIANKALLNIHILNISLGHPIYESAATDPLVQAVEHAAREGLIVVASAGNFGLNRRTGQSGYAGIVSPGNAPSALTSGAVRTFNTVTRVDDRVAPYSSHGPTWYDGFAKPDITAPGDNLLSVAAVGSTLRAAQESRGNTGNYMRLSGTSMAASVTSGVVALMLEVNQRLTPNTVKAVLEYSAIPVLDDAGVRSDALTQGAGGIEVTGAVAYAQAINPDAPVGAPWLSSSVTPSTLIGGVSYVWSQSIIYGGRRVAGATLLSEQRPAWALSIVWGEGMGSEDDNIVWGNDFGDDDNIVWGNLFDEDDNIVWGNNLVWENSAEDDNIVWGNLFDDFGNPLSEDDNIVWGNNIIWGDGLLGFLDDDDNIVWGNLDDDNIVWGNLDDDNIVWGNLYDSNLVSGYNDDDNIVWGNLFDEDDNIVWGNNGELGTVMRWSGGLVGGKASNARARRARAQREGVQQ